MPRGVFALGLVSLFMDVSSEMIHGLLPVFLVGTLGASALALGLIDGLGEAVASITKLFSGVLSDWTGRRRPLLLAGYGLAALTKPLFPLADSVGVVLGARLLDRFGKGIRGAPRDALIADITPPALRGAAYGLRQSMDTVGAFLGPLLAILLLFLNGNDIRAVFAWAVLPAALAVLTIVLLVREPQAPRAAVPARFPIRRDSIAGLGLPYWRIVLLGAVLMMARFSEGFLLLRGRDAGIATAWIPAILIAMNVVYALSAYPAGVLADRWPRLRLLAVSAILLALAELSLSIDGITALLVGTLLWGLHMGCSQGLLAALVAASATAERRGTAFGLFNLVAGLVALLASGLAGVLWTVWGASLAFAVGAGFSVLAVIGSVWLEKLQPRTHQTRTA